MRARITSRCGAVAFRVTSSSAARSSFDSLICTSGGGPGTCIPASRSRQESTAVNCKETYETNHLGTLVASASLVACKPPTMPNGLLAMSRQGCVWAQHADRPPGPLSAGSPPRGPCGPRPPWTRRWSRRRGGPAQRLRLRAAWAAANLATASRTAPGGYPRVSCAMRSAASARVLTEVAREPGPLMSAQAPSAFWTPGRGARGPTPAPAAGRPGAGRTHSAAGEGPPRWSGAWLVPGARDGRSGLDLGK